jgi:hypothetical protein
MRRYSYAARARGLPISSPDSLGASETDLICVGHLVGYTLETVERELILQTLSVHHGNRTQAADVLGISVRSLRDRIRIYKLHGESVPQPRSAGSGRSYQVRVAGLTQYPQEDCPVRFDFEGGSADLARG